MAHRRATIGDGLFWGMTGALFAAIMGGAIGFVFARFYGAGWISGGALGILIFLIASLILARSAANLPPPNTLKAPLAPSGGAFKAPPGGAFRAPDAPPPSESTSYQPVRDEPGHDTGPQSLAEVGHAAGEAVGKAAYSASAAVTSAAQAAKAAITDALEPVTSSKTPDTASSETPATAAGEPRPLADTIPASERVQPETLPGPREGGPDDLKRIRGIGPKLEEMLNAKGYYHFDQMAVWGPAEIAWVDANIEGFYGRATRDDWVGQAKLLASGGETEFSRRVDKGEVY